MTTDDDIRGWLDACDEHKHRLSKWESDHDGVQSRTVSERIFEGPDFTIPQVLHAYEDALRGAGFHCPCEALIVVDDTAAAYRRNERGGDVDAIAHSRD